MITMDSLSAIVDVVQKRPLTAIAITNAVTAAVSIYFISEGKPIKWIYKKLFQAVMSAVPASIMNAEQEKLRHTIEKDVVGHAMADETLYTTLPVQGLSERTRRSANLIAHKLTFAGLSKQDIVSLLDKYAAVDAPRWKRGKVSGTVYHGGDDLVELSTVAFSKYALSNPLHPDVFPSLRKMEAECVAMTLKLFHATDACCGAMTSGGTESILMACKAYRDHARAHKGITEPELVCPPTAHAAFDKACAYFGIKLVHVPVNPVTFKADVDAMLRACSRNTIAMVCSAPSYPQGVVDPVPELAAAALARGIPLHVDCCLGSYLIAFAGQAGFPVPVPFDFSVPGVTSISVDTHKYGFAPKGSSIIMYASRELRHAQYFVAPEWTGGIYASPTIAGSRAGANIAACWATLMHTGQQGYIDAAKKILASTRRIAEGVRALEAAGCGIALYGQPDLSVVCFGPARAGTPGAGHAINIYNVGDAMSARGWNLNVLQNPASIHICVTYANCGSAEEFLVDLREAVEEVRTAPPGKFKDGSGAIYGMAASIPDKSLVATVAHNFLDALYAAKVKV